MYAPPQGGIPCQHLVDQQVMEILLPSEGGGGRSG